jgi:hypothetical protein
MKVRRAKQNSPTTKINVIRLTVVLTFSRLDVHLSGALTALTFNDFPRLWQLLQLLSLWLAIAAVDIYSAGGEQPENLLANFSRSDVYPIYDYFC